MCHCELVGFMNWPCLSHIHSIFNYLPYLKDKENGTNAKVKVAEGSVIFSKSVEHVLKPDYQISNIM